MTIESFLADKVPLGRLRIECNECDALLYDTAPEQPTFQTPSYFKFLTTANARRHHEQTGHSKLTLDVKPARVLDHVDVTITVGDDE